MRSQEMRAYNYYVIPSKSEVLLHTHDDTTRMHTHDDTTRTIQWNQILFRCTNANHQEQAYTTASSGNGV